MDDDWDLQAVVRGCAASTPSTPRTSRGVDIHLSSSFQSIEDHSVFPSDPFKPRSSENIDHLHDLLKPLLPKIKPISPQNIPMTISPLSVLGLKDLSPRHKQEQRKQNHYSFAAAGTNSTTHIPSTRSKRRKNQVKRVCEVPGDGLTFDTWSWRKYGQKPIKGSPYQRGYYKCSTSKGCLARKQVERSISDPGMFIVTYTGDHNHPIPANRNSIAGITRQKSVTPATADDSSKPSSSSPPVSPVSLSPVSGKTQILKDLLMEDDNDELGGVSGTVICDEFFEGLEEFNGDCFPVKFPATLTFPWESHSASNTAAGSFPQHVPQ